MSNVEIEYNTGSGIEPVLLAIGRPGDFFAHGRLFAPMPRVDVEGAGMLAFPVPETQVQDLIKVAGRAPFGRGVETVYGPTIRDCWQIGPDQLRLSGGAWQETFARILESAAKGLGVPADRVEAQFYKFLIYGRGGFFATHRDSEKAPGMIATLTIALPVAGEGGELVVRHKDREFAADMNVYEPSELAFAAFYADCPHEIRPVVKGHRLSLIFNLCLRQGAKSTRVMPPDHEKQIEAITERLIEWRCGGKKTEKIVWALDHKYSEAGLSFETLKNADAARARALATAASRAGFELHAAIIHIEQSGHPGFPNEYFYRRYSDQEDAEVAYMEEVFDGIQELDGWVGQDGSRPQFGTLELKSGELLPVGALDDAVPDKKMLYEATGNEGMTLEHAWRRAALVLWPRQQTLAILARTDIGGAIAWVEEQLSKREGIADTEIRQLASKLIDLWQHGRRKRRKGVRGQMLRLLSAAGDEQALRRFLHEVILSAYTGAENEDLLAVLYRQGPGAAEPFLLALVEAQFAERPRRIMELLRLLTEGQSAQERPAWQACLQGTMRSALCKVSALSEEKVSGDFQVLSNKTVRDLFALAWRWQLASEAEAAANAIVASPALASPERTLPAAIEQLRGETGFADKVAYVNLWRCAANALLARSATEPQEPGNWTIDCNIKCDSDLCVELRAFCRDPRAKVHRFRVRADLRRDLHLIIDRNKLEIDHVTERRGRPYTLVCTKNRAGYRRRLAEYSVDIKWMQSLIRSAPFENVAPDVGSVVARLQDAVCAPTEG